MTNDPLQHRFQYRIVGGDLPVEYHLGTVDVIEVDAGRSVVVYTTEIEPVTLAEAFEGAISGAVQALPMHLS